MRRGRRRRGLLPLPVSLTPAFLVALLAPTGAAPQSAPVAAPLRGFPAALLEDHLAREERLRALPSADTLRERVRRLAAEPHEAGSEGSRRVAERLLDLLRAWGLDARIERYEALMPRPVTRSLELLAPEPFTAALREPPIPGDPESGPPGAFPAANVYAGDGDVTAEVVYVSYGLPEDYRVLDSLGVSVEGRIVLARYGRAWRGIKPKLAAERGAVGCLLYSDPRDDGYWVAPVYPEGPMRPWEGVQRGSVMDMPVHPGDPLTPGWASVDGAPRLSLEEARTVLDIPVLPLSYSDALPILRSLAGPVAPEAWRGALPTTYRLGPGPAVVRLALEHDWSIRPLHNVVARVPGAVYPDQWVIFGNHHDAWVQGAQDPLAGLAALLEVARGVGDLLETGWRPARTLVFAAWDGEEWGLLGSTEWAEHHADELRDKGAVYLGSDLNEAGGLWAAGSHSLQAFLAQVARDVADPETGASVLDVWLERRGLPRADTLFAIDALGAGSDFTAFLDHLGMATANMSFVGERPWGVYHSAYDTFSWYERFGDPGFRYGAAQARLMGTALLRLADAPVLPLEFGGAARTYRGYLDEIEEAARARPETRDVDLEPVRDALVRLAAAAGRYEVQLARLNGLGAAEVERRRDALGAVNRILSGAERALTDPEGLPGRPWYRHLVYAPGLYTGYGVKTMAGIREAVEDRPDPAAAGREAARVGAALSRYAAEVERAAEVLSEALR